MNSFGKIFKVQVFGESHGHSVGVVIDACPSGILINEDDFNLDLSRRKSGAKGTTSRKEADTPLIISGIHNNYTTGAPITILFKNSDTRSSDYNFKDHPRPGHADFVADKKFNSFNDGRGGGHFSGRITVGVVAAGVIAKKIIPDISIKAKLIEAGGINDISKAIDNAIKKQDSIGGIIECVISNVPIGFGEPFFNSIESLISHAMFSIPGIRAIEFGNGFASASMFGSEHNDLIVNEVGMTKTNNAGGLNGGISNGNDIVFRIAVKPTSSISLLQNTFNFNENINKPLKIKGRHDACIALRIPVIVEALTACVIADFKIILK